MKELFASVPENNGLFGSYNGFSNQKTLNDVDRSNIDRFIEKSGIQVKLEASKEKVIETLGKFKDC